MVIKNALEIGEQLVVVRRNHVFRDCMRWFKRPDFDVEKNLKVKFLGELGADFGGPRRECLQKIITDLTQSGIFQGKVGYLFPSPNIAKLVDKSVYNAGRMISSVICHGGPAPRMFHPPSCRLYLWQGSSESRRHTTLRYKGGSYEGKFMSDNLSFKIMGD